MSLRTPFANLLELEPGEPLSTANFFFQQGNPEIIDILLRLAVIAHRHDAHPALTPVDPEIPAVPVVSPVGGTIPADTTIVVGYTLVDADGGETAFAAEPTSVTTQPALLMPDSGPDLEVDHAAGTLLASNYSYAVTVTDGTGGETALGPVNQVTIDPGTDVNQIIVSGLTQIMEDAGGTGWRLWRAVNSGRWGLVEEGTTDEVTDDGDICVSCFDPPTDTNQTNATSKLTVTVPDGQPAEASEFRIYGSVDGDFGYRSLLGAYPAADFGVAKEFLGLNFLKGAPPDISLAQPGANKIDPDTDMLDFPWKRSVATVGDLPATGNTEGDTRLVLATGTLYSWDGDSWEVTAGGGGGGGHTIEDETGTPLTARTNLKFQGLTVSDDAGEDATVVTAEGPVRPTARVIATQEFLGLATDEVGQGTITLAPGYRIIQVSTSEAARVRLYATTAHRDADETRLDTVDPSGDHGLYLDLETDPGQLSYVISPQVHGSNLNGVPDDQIPVNVTMLEAAPSGDPLVVTIVYVPTETIDGKVV